MSIAPASVLRDYDLIWSGDTALDVPALPSPPEPLPDEPAEAFAARVDAVATERARIDRENEEVLDRARATGVWPLRAGDTPTIFRIRQVPSWRPVERIASGLGIREVASLVFRLGCVGITNSPLGFTPKLEEHIGLDGRRSGLGKVMDAAVVDALDKIDRDIVDEIAGLIMRQKGGPLGK